MNRVKRNFKRDVKQLYPDWNEITRNGLGFGCPATPAPTLPVSLCDSRNSIVGAGLSDSHQSNAGGREEMKEEAKDTENPVCHPWRV